MIKRKLGFDNLGRITIPEDIRDMLGIGGKNNVMIVYDNDKLIIPKVDDTKVITESIEVCSIMQVTAMLLQAKNMRH